MSFHTVWLGVMPLIITSTKEMADIKEEWVIEEIPPTHECGGCPGIGCCNADVHFSVVVQI